jgi:hypothetical protein
VTVADNLPGGVDLISATGPAGSCAAQGEKVTCAIGTLDPVGVAAGRARLRPPARRLLTLEGVCLN